jgi:polysaccharide pyruvyl transferase WcaK-like protein
MGVGWKKYQSKANCFAKLFYKPLLSKKYLHSVRDSYTENQMRAMGYDNVINTACPTTWDLTPEHCAAIPKTKRESVVFTITDYAKDPQRMKMMLDSIRMNYKKIYFFQQSVGDLEYLKEITDIGDLCIISPTLKAYDQLLENEHPDFVGTRLHGGIRALQHSCRALIIGIDNRAAELSKDIHLPVLPVESLDQLGCILQNGWKIALTLPRKNIEIWKAQF